jgi:hypothetical protein
MSETTEHPALPQVRAALERETERRRAAEASAAEVPTLRRQVALWRAGIKPGAAAELFVSRMGDDVDLDDPDAVRRVCAEITASVLEQHHQLDEVVT